MNYLLVYLSYSEYQMEKGDRLQNTNTETILIVELTVVLLY